MACELKPTKLGISGYVFLVTRSWQNIPIFSNLFVSALVYNSMPDWICLSSFVPYMTVKQSVWGLEASKKNNPRMEKQANQPKNLRKKVLVFLPVLFSSLVHCTIQSNEGKGQTMAANLGLTWASKLYPRSCSLNLFKTIKRKKRNMALEQEWKVQKKPPASHLQGGWHMELHLQASLADQAW